MYKQIYVESSNPVIKGELTRSCTVSSVDVVIIMVCLHSNIHSKEQLHDLLLPLFTVHNVLKVMRYPLLYCFSLKKQHSNCFESVKACL